jgi:hypothetical protein
MELMWFVLGTPFDAADGANADGVYAKSSQTFDDERDQKVSQYEN